MTYFNLPEESLSNKIYKSNLESFLKNGCYPSYTALQSGKKILTSFQETVSYSAIYQIHHQAKLDYVFRNYNWSNLRGKEVDIIDWGSGQAFASLSLLEFIKKYKMNINVKSISLIDASKVSVNRGIDYLDTFLKEEHQLNKFAIYPIISELDLLKSTILPNYETTNYIHLFSNVLDIYSIDLLLLSNFVLNNYKGYNNLFCIGPNYSNSILRINEFTNLFNTGSLVTLNNGLVVNIPSRYFNVKLRQFIVGDITCKYQIVNVNFN